MKIHFEGAARTVTGSQHLLEVNGSRILLECGLFQGRRADTYEVNRNFPFDPKTLDAVILSHAHIDHSGNLPNLINRGFSGPIYATPATADLADIMLRDSGHIQEADAEYVSKKRARKGQPPVEPLYTKLDAERVAEQLVEKEYEEPFHAASGVTVRFYDAGHILGSAGVALDIEEKGRRMRLWFSGDIGREKLPLLQDPILPEAAEYLIMEATYGDKEHRDPELAYQEFREVVLRTCQRGGKVIIPAFSVGRTQEMVYFLNIMTNDGDLSGLPVFVDSPLAVNATDIFKRHTDLFDSETAQLVREMRHPALNFDGLNYIRSVDESKAINQMHGPMVIISASGMAESGRILHHLKNNIENTRNTVMIVSWQAPHTLGRRIAERQPMVKIFGEPFPLRAEVATIGGLSAHAGQDMLLKYALNTKASLRKTFLVHGEEKATSVLMEKMAEAQLSPVYYPTRGQVFEV